MDTFGTSLRIVGKNSSEEIDLISNMTVFTNEIEKVLHEIIKKEIYTRKFKKDHFEWLEFRYKYINESRLNTKNEIDLDIIKI